MLAMEKYADAKKTYDEVAKKHTDAVNNLEAALSAPELEDKEVKKLKNKLKKLKASAPREPPVPLPRMCAEEIPLMLNLGTSLKLLLAGSSTTESRRRGGELLSRYLIDFKRVSPHAI